MLGEKLLKSGIITQAQLEECLAEQAASGKRIGELLVAKGYATQAQIDAALAK
ncbi:MAG: hypothetical protein J0L75_03110 [Spirochaetes bacterium]|nr:hypothetical protein [Spirochaetota bacterium]